MVIQVCISPEVITENAYLRYNYILKNVIVRLYPAALRPTPTPRSEVILKPRGAILLCFPSNIVRFGDHRLHPLKRSLTPDQNRYCCSDYFYLNIRTVARNEKKLIVVVYRVVTAGTGYCMFSCCGNVRNRRG